MSQGNAEHRPSGPTTQAAAKGKLTLGGVIALLVVGLLSIPQVRAKLGLPAQQGQPPASTTSSQLPGTADDAPRRRAEQVPVARGDRTTPAEPTGGTRTATTPASSSKRAQGARTIIEAYRAGRSDVLVEFECRVRKLLPPDNDGKPHQRMIVEIAGGHSLLIAHNLELADAVPAREGDSLVVFGEYEWNEQGGVVHWTHHDPKGWRPDGWIEHKGVLYK